MAGLLGTAAFPPKLVALPSDPDVVVVGAGAAGIAAAHRLIASGLSVIIVEAADRIGGRAYTESDTFGVPYDHGCAWLQGPDDLPWLGIAAAEGIKLHNHDYAGFPIYIDGKKASTTDMRKFDRTWSRFQAGMERATKDVAASSVAPLDAPYAAIAASWIGPMDHGVDLTELSTGDFNAYKDYDVNYLVREGYGTLVALHGAGLPIKLSTPVTAIDYSGAGVKVETRGGAISAKACIVTVSVGVLAAGGVKFTPELPAEKQSALDDVPMGLLNKITLQFDGERFGLKKNDFLSHAIPNDLPAEVCYFLTFPSGLPYAVGFVGGAFGWDISRGDPADAIDFALSEFEKSVGSRARKHFVKGHMTDWATNPLTMGAYSAARPGKHASRAVLREPLAERVFFAGEATSDGYIALCAGAHINGDKVGAEVAATLAECASCAGPGAQKRRLKEPAE